MFCPSKIMVFIRIMLSYFFVLWSNTKVFIYFLTSFKHAIHEPILCFQSCKQRNTMTRVFKQSLLGLFRQLDGLFHFMYKNLTYFAAHEYIYLFLMTFQHWKIYVGGRYNLLTLIDVEEVFLVINQYNSLSAC